MNRRQFIKNLGVGAATLTLQACYGASQKGSAGALNGQKPNFLFIIADDQSPFDLKIYNRDSILDTPVLDPVRQARGAMLRPVVLVAHHQASGGLVSVQGKQPH